MVFVGLGSVNCQQLQLSKRVVISIDFFVRMLLHVYCKAGQDLIRGFCGMKDHHIRIWCTSILLVLDACNMLFDIVVLSLHQVLHIPKLFLIRHISF